MRRILALILIFGILLGPESHALAYQLIPDFICDIGIQLFEQGRYTEARDEFKKALLIDPESSRAKEYLVLTESRLSTEEAAPAENNDAGADTDTRAAQISAALDTLETTATPPADSDYEPHVAQPALPSTVPPSPQPRLPAATTTAGVSKVITLDEGLKSARFPIEVEKGSRLIVRGQNISRYIITQPDIIRVDKLSPDELSLTVNDFGYTYLHVWDARDRWTIEFLGLPAKPAGPTLEDEYRQAQEQSRTFKFKYLLDWNEYETGRRIHDLERSSYYWSHSLTLEGETPYGMFDSTAIVRDIQSSTDLTYFTMGIQEGKYGPFEGFHVRVFDFAPNISNLAFSSGTYRGAMLESPAFDKTINYTVFSGREGGGKYGSLSPGLAGHKDSYIEGAQVNYTPQAGQLYSASAFHGYGSERPDDVKDYGYDLKLSRGFNPWRFDYEVGYDTENFSHLATTNYLAPNIKSTLEFRDTSKDFTTMTGTGWRAGEIGALNAIDWRLTDDLEWTNRLDVYQDRLFPNPDDTSRLNEDWSTTLNYVIDDKTSARLDYALTNDLGKLTPMRGHNFGAGIYRGIDFWTLINTYLNYRHQESEYFASHINDYTDDKIILGASLRIIGDLYYYTNGEFNWLTARYYGTQTHPTAFETGLDWNSQVLRSPYYLDLRLTYRNEEDTESPVSFLSGEDYIEYYGEIAYRPRPAFEAFYSTRIRNVFSNDNPNVSKRLEATLYAGLRMTWDTGFSWDPIGELSGYVFNDTNSDGLRQAGEQPIKDIRILAGNRSAVSDSTGYFYFSRIKARKATVRVDTASLPRGYVMTTPQVQEINVKNGKLTSINFGIVSRTEIIGAVFIDKNGNGKYDTGEKGIRGVTVRLENGTQAVTDEMGRYYFRQTSVGPHKVSLELSSLPSTYLPTTPVFTTIELTEGASYICNFPMKKIAE